MKTILSALLCVLSTASSYSQHLFETATQETHQYVSSGLSQRVTICRCIKDIKYPLPIVITNEDLGVEQDHINLKTSISLITKQLHKVSSAPDHLSQKERVAIIQCHHIYNTAIDGNGSLRTGSLIRPILIGNFERMQYLVYENVAIDYPNKTISFLLRESANCDPSALIS